MNITTRKIPIVLACDEAYGMPLATTLRSIVESNQANWPLEFHVLSDNISEGTRVKVFDSLPENSASIQWYQIDLGAFQKFSTISYISKMTYARFLLPGIFPENIEKVLYLDTDILVVDDLLPLMATELQDNVLGAVLDAMDAQFKNGEAKLAGVPKVQNYFNAGILLINLGRWRKERISEKALEYLDKYPQSPYSDQDAINVACDRKWQKLEGRWNFHSNHFNIMLADLRDKEKPAIVHFVTSLKPWKPSSLSVNADFYDSFRNRTRFARSPLDKLLDIITGCWSYVKDLLKQYAFFRAIKDRLRIKLNH